MFAAYSNSPTRRTNEQGPMSAQDVKNARRLAKYIARRQGTEEPRLTLFKI